ncbi:flagellar biosynthesis anti-sigma factor FlgM [Kluyvera sp. NPDC087067]|uniref:flagellar biosynthesis anti-sigma factor FlgM n=1 Tax=Kluyvera sp. NPDC087067 TaxID=3364105 RepID=UPI0037F78898
MSIDRTSSLKAVTSVQPREMPETSAQKARADKSTTATSASVTLSNAQTALTRSDSSDINTARVEELKTAIRNGELKMDTGKIADALIQDTQDYLQSK